MVIYEPRQVRKEAAVSKHYHVPQIHLIGANWCSNAGNSNHDGECTIRSIKGFFPDTSNLLSFLFYRQPTDMTALEGGNDGAVREAGQKELF